MPESYFFKKYNKLANTKFHDLQIFTILFSKTNHQGFKLKTDENHKHPS